MWKHHWRIKDDPFLSVGTPFVRSATHDEALARLVNTIETGERLAVLQGAAGIGKSAVLARAIAETKGPQRRFSRVAGAVDAVGILSGLAAGLGVSVPKGAGRSAAWKGLADAVKLCRWQKIHAVLVLDDCETLSEPADLRDLQRLTHLDANPNARLTVIRSYRDPVDDGASADVPIPAWHLVIRLATLTRSETQRFIEEKLAAAGRTEAAFTPRALGRLHDLSGGVPRGIERLGSLCLMAAALRGLELVAPDVVDGVAGEATLPWPEFAV